MYQGNAPTNEPVPPYQPGLQPYPGWGPYPPAKKGEVVPVNTRLLLTIPFWILMALAFIAIFPSLAVVTPELMKHSPPAQIPLPSGILAVVYFFFIMFMVLASFYVLMVKDGKALLKWFSRKPALQHLQQQEEEPEGVKDNAILLIAEFFMADIALLITTVMLLTIFGYNMHVPSSLTESKVWELMFMLAEASVIEELFARVLMIGIPLLFIDSHRARKRKAAHRYFTGGGFKIDTPAMVVILFSSFVFGMAHLGWDWYKAILSGVTAAFFAYLFLRKGLYAAILLHFAFDYTGILTEWTGDPAVQNLETFLFLACFFIGFIPLYIYTQKAYRFYRGFSFHMPQLKVSVVAVAGILFLVMGMLFSLYSVMYLEDETDTSEDEYTVGGGEYTSLRLLAGKEQDVEMDVTVTDGSTISIYIFNVTEYEKWKNGEESDPIYARDGTSEGHFSGDGDGEKWVFTLDNEGSGDVTAEMKVKRINGGDFTGSIIAVVMAIIGYLFGIGLLGATMNLNIPGVRKEEETPGEGASGEKGEWRDPRTYQQAEWALPGYPPQYGPPQYGPPQYGPPQYDPYGQPMPPHYPPPYPPYQQPPYPAYQQPPYPAPHAPEHNYPPHYQSSYPPPEPHHPFPGEAPPREGFEDRESREQGVAESGIERKQSEEKKPSEDRKPSEDGKPRDEDDLPDEENDLPDEDILQGDGEAEFRGDGFD